MTTSIPQKLEEWEETPSWFVSVGQWMGSRLFHLYRKVQRVQSFSCKRRKKK